VNPDMFCGALVLGFVLTIVGIFVIMHRVWDNGESLRDLPWLILGPMLLGWLIVPWVFYGLTLLPWSQIRKVWPTVEDTATRYNPNGHAPQVEQ